MAKLPSGRFPFVGLSKALDRAQSIFDNDKAGKGLKVPVAFAAWGYSDKSSGGFQTIAALKGYGLLVDEGANDDRSVKLTSDARHYFQSEIENDKSDLRAKFASRPPLFSHLLDHWGGQTVDDPVARTYLKTSLGMNDQSARSALGIYKENLSYSSGKGDNTAPGNSSAPESQTSNASGVIDGTAAEDISSAGVTTAANAQVNESAASASLTITFDMKSVTVYGRTSSPDELQVFIDDLTDLKSILIKRIGKADV